MRGSRWYRSTTLLAAAGNDPRLQSLVRHARRRMLTVAGVRGQSLRMQLAHHPFPLALIRHDLAQVQVLASKAGSGQPNTA